MKIKIRQGDSVEVIAGNYKGSRGEVQQVIRKKDKKGQYDPNRVYVIVAGVNIVTKHQRRSPGVNTQTGRIEMEAPIHISNVSLIGSDGSPTRAGYRYEGDDKIRFDRKSGDPLLAKSGE